MSGKKKKSGGRSAYPLMNDPLLDLQQAASMTECTGILPAQIATADEGEHIASLMDIPPVRPADSGEKQHTAEKR